MPRETSEAPSEEKVRRQVGRTVANGAAVLLSLAVLGAWSYFGFYTLKPGEAAVILRFGRYVETVAEPGLRWHLPPPVESHEIVNVGSINREEFGYRSGASPSEEEKLEAAMQTSDNNIVHLSFMVQYRVKDAFQARYRIARPREVLRDAAQASVRGVVGRNTIDDVLTRKRGIVQSESRDDLQATLDLYQAGLEVLSVELQDVQPPEPVRAAFDDVLSSIQDRDRTVNDAKGYANEVLPKARARSIELVEAARGYKESKVALATGEASRFRALATEYEKAPEVVRTRLFLETMEAVLPDAHVVIVQPGSAVVPYLPLDREPSLPELQRPATEHGATAPKPAAKASPAKAAAAPAPSGAAPETGR
jgi:membrane protease subunit HflK